MDGGWLLLDGGAVAGWQWQSFKFFANNFGCNVAANWTLGKDRKLSGQPQVMPLPCPESFEKNNTFPVAYCGQDSWDRSMAYNWFRVAAATQFSILIPRHKNSN